MYINPVRRGRRVDGSFGSECRLISTLHLCFLDQILFAKITNAPSNFISPCAHWPAS